MSGLHFNLNDESGRIQLLAVLRRAFELNREVVIICVGTDRSAGDSLGPLVGTLLKELYPRAVVYGTLDDPVHATNLEEKMQTIENNHPGAYLLAVDASLGNLDKVGHITFKPEPLIPGVGVKKVLPQVGHACITGIVNVGGFLEYFALQNTRLWTTYCLAKVIAGVIAQALICKVTMDSIAVSGT